MKVEWRLEGKQTVRKLNAAKEGNDRSAVRVPPASSRSINPLFRTAHCVQIFFNHSPRWGGVK